MCPFARFMHPSPTHCASQASADAKKREARRAIKELNEPRKTVVKRAFQKLDRDNSGVRIMAVHGIPPFNNSTCTVLLSAANYNRRCEGGIQRAHAPGGDQGQYDGGRSTESVPRAI